MHEQGQLTVNFGSIYTTQGKMIDNLTMILDTDMCGVIKYGDSRDVWLKDYFLKLQNSQAAFGLNTDNIIMVEFDKYDGILNIDGICTIANWLLSCGGNAGNFIKMSEEELISKVKLLQEIGY